MTRTARKARPLCAWLTLVTLHAGIGREASAEEDSRWVIPAEPGGKQSAPLAIGRLEDLPGISLDLGEAKHQALALGGNLEDWTLQDLDSRCPATMLPYDLGAPHGRVDLLLPKGMTLTGDIRASLGPDGREKTLTFLEDGVNRTFRVLVGLGLACADRLYRPVLLSATHPGYGSRPGERLLTFEPESIGYLCMKIKPKPEAAPSWRCGRGHLADGVIGYAVLDNASRAFFAKALKWGPHTYDLHFEFADGAGSVAWRIAPKDRNGYTFPHAWGLNPRDRFPDGFSRRSKIQDYLAATALKSATNRSGVAISPYNTPNMTGSARFDPELLNQCEEGYRGEIFDRLDTYGPDVASNGSLGHGILIDLQVAPWYRNPHTGCDWARIWNLPETPIVTRDGCSAFRVQSDPQDASGTLPIMGVNLGFVDGSPQRRRCPTWAPCPIDRTCCVHRIAQGMGRILAIRADHTLWIGEEGSAGTLMGDPAGIPRRDLVEVALSPFQLCVITESGSLHCTEPGGGSKAAGAKAGPALGAEPLSSAPGVPLPGVAEVSLAAEHACARTLRGTVHCWGRGWGASARPDRHALLAVEVAGAAPAARLVSGRRHSCALKLDGAVACWGGNDHGQLGAVKNARASAPFDIPLSEVADLDASLDHTCARKRDGTVWCWGLLGKRRSDRPVAIPGVEGARQMVTHGRMGCVLGGAAEVSCWNFDELPGTPFRPPRLHRIRFPLEPDSAREVGIMELGRSGGAGSARACAKGRDGRVYCWRTDARPPYRASEMRISCD